MYVLDKLNWNNGVFHAVNDEGVEVKCEAVVAFEAAETGKTYIIYTDNTFEEDGSLKVYASTYDFDTERLGSVDTDEEWHIVEKVLEEYQNGELDED